VAGTARVIEAARHAGVGRLVHISSPIVLVDGRRPITDADESHPSAPRPYGRYAASKAESERLVLVANGDGMETVIVRYAHAWGARDASLLRGLVAAVETGRFRWIDGGHQRVSTTHVANIVEGLILAAERGRPGEIYFITNGEPVKLREFATVMLAAIGVTPPGSLDPARGCASEGGAARDASGQSCAVGAAPPVTRTAVALLGLSCTVTDAKARRELGYSPLIARPHGLTRLAAEAR